MSDFQREAELCARLAALRRILPRPAIVREPTFGVANVLAALGGFMECVRYLNTRRSAGAILKLEEEAHVQDAVYIMLRLWVTDLQYENPTDKIGNRYVIKDFLIPSLKTVVEAKFVRDKTHGKNISKELHDDIEMYSRHPLCEELVFFVYDPDKYIPDVGALSDDIVRPRQYGNKGLRTHLVVRP